jgi:hypothetical protein
MEDGTLAYEKKVGTVPFIPERARPWTVKRRRRFRTSHAGVCPVFEDCTHQWHDDTNNEVISSLLCILNKEGEDGIERKNIFPWVKFFSTLG